MNNIVDFNRKQIEKEIIAAKAKTQFSEIEHRLKLLPQYRGSVPSKTFLAKDPLIKKGQCYWIENEHGLFVVVEKNKKGIQLSPLDMNATVSAGYTIYEMNQTLVAKEPLMDLGDWENTHLRTGVFKDIADEIAVFLEATGNQTYLLYGRDLHYFTIFNYSSDVRINSIDGSLNDNYYLENILSCLTNWDIVSIDVDMSVKEDMPKVEFWVRDKQNNTESALANHMLYLLPYDDQVIALN